MIISGSVLADQYQRGRRLWPIIDVVEAEFELPPFLLWAIGSRETGLRAEYAEGKVHDDGHGWGLFGADDRWNTLDLPRFASDPEEQARLAARTLKANLGVTGSWLDAANAYGPVSGRPAYGHDVMERATYLAEHTRSAPPMTPVQIIEAAARELEAAGFEVWFEDGWQDRGRPGEFIPQGMVWHHTADQAYDDDYAIKPLIVDGRSDLPGPLSQWGLGRSGKLYVIAAGKANHAGGGGWRGLSGNFSVWGCEAANDGIGEPWPDRQVEAYVALGAALARHTGYGAEMNCRHAEWSDAGKIDTATAPLDDGDWIRAQVAARLASPQPEGDLHMLTFRYVFDGLDWVFDGPSSLFFQLNDTVQITEVLDPLGVKALGQVSPSTHKRYSEIAAAAGFKG